MEERASTATKDHTTRKKLNQGKLEKNKTDKETILKKAYAVSFKKDLVTTHLSLQIILQKRSISATMPESSTIIFKVTDARQMITKKRKFYFILIFI